MDTAYNTVESIMVLVTLFSLSGTLPLVWMATNGTHYFFLATTILGLLGWLLAFIFQAIATAQFGHRSVGSLWFAILLQAFLTIGVILSVATDSIQSARFQLAAFGVISTVFAVQGTDTGVFSPEKALQAMGAGYLILALVDILWVLYFTCEADSLILHLINRLGTGGLQPPVPRRRSLATLQGTISKPNYALGSGVGSPDMGIHEPKRGSVALSVIGSLKRPQSAASLKRSGTAHSNASRKSLVGSIIVESDPPYVEAIPPVPMLTVPDPPSILIPPLALSPASKTRTPINIESPESLKIQGGVTHSMLPGVIVVSPPPQPPPTSVPDSPPPRRDSVYSLEEEPILRARALHAYRGSPQDPNELSFSKGEVLEIEDQEGKWWQAKKADGTLGIVPSNYLVMI